MTFFWHRKLYDLTSKTLAYAFLKIQLYVIENRLLKLIIIDTANQLWYCGKLNWIHFQTINFHWVWVLSINLMKLTIQMKNSILLCHSRKRMFFRSFCVCWIVTCLRIKYLNWSNHDSVLFGKTNLKFIYLIQSKNNYLSISFYNKWRLIKDVKIWQLLLKDVFVCVKTII